MDLDLDTASSMTDWSISPKRQVSKSLRFPPDIVEELEAIAAEVSTPEVSYTFTDVTMDLLRKAIHAYRTQHPKQPKTKTPSKRE